DLRILGVEHLALHRRREPGTRLAPAPRLFLLLLLGGDPLVLLLLGTDRVGLGEVDLAAAALAPSRPVARVGAPLAFPRLLPGACRRAARCLSGSGLSAGGLAGSRLSATGPGIAPAVVTRL